MLNTTQFAVVVSGTYPPTFTLYEAIFMGALPVFVNARESPMFGPNVPRAFAAADMPFGDDGVEPCYDGWPHRSRRTIFIRRPCPCPDRVPRPELSPVAAQVQYHVSPRRRFL